jgi:hypothetical protein
MSTCSSSMHAAGRRPPAAFSTGRAATTQSQRSPGDICDQPRVAYVDSAHATASQAMVRGGQGGAFEWIPSIISNLVALQLQERRRWQLQKWKPGRR